MRSHYQHIEHKFSRLYKHQDIRNHKEESDSTNKRKAASTPDVPQTIPLITATAHLLAKLKTRLLVPEHDLESISLAVCRGLYSTSSASGKIIQAAAGGGKTTLLNTILEHYRHGPNRCLYVSGRDVNGRDR